MSSTYRALCLSHDPALEIDGAEWNTVTDIEGALANPAACDGLGGHTTCDLLGGAYSYPLYKVYCPKAREWIGVEWLALLLAAYLRADADAVVTAAGQPMPRHWTRQRLMRLRAELMLE